VALGAFAVLVAYGTAWLPGGAPPWGVWAMIAGTALMLSATMALGVSRSTHTRSPLLWGTAFLLLVVIAGFGLPLLLPPDAASAALWLGLPRRAAIEIYGVGLLPLLVLPGLFAWEFRIEGLDDQSLIALRAECEALMRGAPRG
jgi:hypothetical protein